MWPTRQKRIARPWWWPVAEYWWLARAPWTALLFVAPALAMYELARWWCGSGAVAVTADLAMRRGLGLVGLGEHYWLPLVLVVALLAWQVRLRAPWRATPAVYAAMAVESLGWSLALLMIARGQWELGRLMWGAAGQSLPAADSGGWQMWLRCAGAGVYEEALFRLAGVPLIALLARRMGSSYRVSVVLSVALSSLAFACAHQWGGEQAWDLGRLVYHCLAGGSLAAIFLCRGFGVAAGTHMAFDLLVATR